ncbi:MAG: 50S ribosomal protein L17 [Verrucomicrobia bacterium]|nr:50S ribosomal protein L17 [Cytophagales bacterium]
METTLAKAKELRKYVEPLLTKSKNDTTHSRRTVFAYLKNKESVKELFGDIAEKIAERPGGYTRIIKLGNRLGDNAELCIIELVDYNKTMLEAKTEVKKTRRGRRGTKKSENSELIQEGLVDKTEETIEPQILTPEVKSSIEETQAVEDNTPSELKVTEKQEPIAEDENNRDEKKNSEDTENEKKEL